MRISSVRQGVLSGILDVSIKGMCRPYLSTVYVGPDVPEVELLVSRSKPHR